SRRSSDSGSPKCMKRPPLQVPIAVAVGSMDIRLEARGGTGSQGCLEASERVGDELFPVVLAGCSRQFLRAGCDTGAQLLQLGDAKREILSALAAELCHRQRQGLLQCDRGKVRAALVQVQAGAQGELLAQQAAAAAAEQRGQTLLRTQGVGAVAAASHRS